MYQKSSYFREPVIQLCGLIQEPDSYSKVTVQVVCEATLCAVLVAQLQNVTKLEMVQKRFNNMFRA